MCGGRGQEIGDPTTTRRLYVPAVRAVSRVVRPPSPGFPPVPLGSHRKTPAALNARSNVFLPSPSAGSSPPYTSTAHVRARTQPTGDFVCMAVKRPTASGRPDCVLATSAATAAASPAASAAPPAAASAPRQPQQPAVLVADDRSRHA